MLTGGDTSETGGHFLRGEEVAGQHGQIRFPLVTLEPNT